MQQLTFIWHTRSWYNSKSASWCVGDRRSTVCGGLYVGLCFFFYRKDGSNLDVYTKDSFRNLQADRKKAWVVDILVDLLVLQQRKFRQVFKVRDLIILYPLYWANPHPHVFDRKFATESGLRKLHSIKKKNFIYIFSFQQAHFSNFAK
jgi:hypothetical protein